MQQSSNLGNIPKKRKATGPRSKSGCATCRIRRVKCDETKPDCQRCCSTGRRCDWYINGTISTSSITKRESIKPLQPTMYLIAPIPSKSYEERRSFEFFQARTAPQLSGVFLSKFWDQLVLRSAHHNPTIWHAVVALGSIHEKFETADLSMFSVNDDSNQAEFALQHYTIAIQNLTKPLNQGIKQSADILLTACLLFISYEIMQGHHGSALAHTKSGIKLIDDIQKEQLVQGNSLALDLSSTPLIPLEVLTTLFTRLDSQLCELQTTSGVRIRKFTQVKELEFEPSIPEKFSSVLEARDCFDYLYNDAIHQVNDPEAGDLTSAAFRKIQPQKSDAINRLRQWNVSFDAFLQQANLSLDDKTRKAANLLKLQHAVATQAFETSGLKGEMFCDQYLDHYSSIINWAEMIVQMPTEHVNQTPLRKAVSLEAGIIAPLFHTIWKCRNSQLRKRGINVLKRYPRQEGVWDGTLVSIVSERIVAIEEKEFGEIINSADLPEWARISEVGVQFDLGKRLAMLSYSRHSSKSDPTIIRIPEVLKW